MKIMDQNGRVGEVTEIREDGIFAKPENTPYNIQDSGNVTGVSGAILITATWWQKQSDGNFRGLWFDSPQGAFINATEVADEKNN